MRNILIPVAVFILGICLSLLLPQLAPLCFLVGALVNIFVNRRGGGKAREASDAERHRLLIRSSYALMLPSFIFVAVIAFSMAAAIIDRAG